MKGKFSHLLSLFRVRMRVIPNSSSKYQGMANNYHELAMNSDNKHNYCVEHPGSELRWRCAECGKEFCDNCLRIIKYWYRGVLERTATCPVCKERCIDFVLEREKAQELKQKEIETKKEKILRAAGFLFFLVIFILRPNDYTFFCLVTFAVWQGPLRKIDIPYKMISLFATLVISNPLFSIASEFFIFERFNIYLKYLTIAIILTVLCYLSEKVSHLFSSIYR